jgi:hypothetical protein
VQSVVKPLRLTGDGAAKADSTTRQMRIWLTIIPLIGTMAGILGASTAWTSNRNVQAVLTSMWGAGQAFAVVWACAIAHVFSRRLSTLIDGCISQTSNSMVANNNDARLKSARKRVLFSATAWNCMSLLNF